jgi:hypothetical protein
VVVQKFKDEVLGSKQDFGGTTKILARVGPWDWSGVTAPPNDSQVEGAALLPSPRSSKFFGSSGPGIFPNWPFPHGFPSPVVDTFSRDLKTPENLSS